ncbi:MAG: tripartite tricarboxylate transporter TctB family protein [Desulfuromonadales bacterium]
MNAKARDLLGSVLMLAFVASLWVQRDYNTPFGGIFPDVVMVGLAVLLVITILLMMTPLRAIKDSEEKAQGKASFHWFDLALVGGILLAWTVLLRYFGFIATGLFGFASISWFLNERRNSLRGLIESALVGAVMVTVLVIVFQYLLKVPLPKGNFFG